MKYQIKLDDACTAFSLYIDGNLAFVKDDVYSILIKIAELEGIEFEAKFSESYMLDVLTYNHGLQIEVLD